MTEIAPAEGKERMARLAVVEDDDVVRELVLAILSDRGYEVEGFATLGEATTALVDAPPDLLVTDVELPDGCGLDLVGTLRDRSGRRVPAIVLSSLNQERDFVRGFAAGAADYLAKPFKPEELLARCSVHLSRLAAQPDAFALETGLPEQGGLAFGRYKVERELGRGGYGQVYLAKDATANDKAVALKVLAPTAGDEHEAKQRFVRETYTLASLADPHVARVHDVGASQGRMYLAMEYVEGTSLAALVVEKGVLSEGAVRGLARGLLGALGAVARAGLVHRDVKPANVILRGGDVSDPVLVDFGLAKHPFDRGITEPSMMVGTPAFMPPEVIHGHDPDPRSDLFALGLTLRYALAGEEVFPDLEGIDLLTAIARGPIPPPGGDLTFAFGAFLDTLLAVEPGRRFQSADDALAALAALEPLGGRGDPFARRPGENRDGTTQVYVHKPRGDGPARSG